MYKKTKKSGFENLNSSISQFSKELNLKMVREKIEIMEMWNEIVGENVYKKVEPDRFNDGILYVSVTNSTWLNQMAFIKDDIIDKYKQKIGKKVVKDIKCFIRKVNEEAKPIRKKNSNSDDKRKLIINKKISEDEIKQIEKQSSVIEDERLRDALQKFLEKGRNKELSMLSQGWKKCSVCRAAHKEKGDICLTCKSR